MRNTLVRYVPIPFIWDGLTAFGVNISYVSETKSCLDNDYLLAHTSALEMTQLSNVLITDDLFDSMYYYRRSKKIIFQVDVWATSSWCTYISIYILRCKTVAI